MKTPISAPRDLSEWGTYKKRRWKAKAARNAKILEMVKNGYRIADIAERFGVSATTVYNLINKSRSEGNQ